IQDTILWSCLDFALLLVVIGKQAWKLQCDIEVFFLLGDVYRDRLESVRIEQCNLSGVTSFDMAFYNSGIEKVIIRDNDYPTAPSFLLSIKHIRRLRRDAVYRSLRLLSL
ncbi:hypothetical protein C7U72_28865, partial [Escherichia coli]